MRFTLLYHESFCLIVGDILYLVIAVLCLLLWPNVHSGYSWKYRFQQRLELEYKWLELWIEEWFLGATLFFFFYQTLCEITEVLVALLFSHSS